MGYFYSLRGWLEFGSDDFDRVIGQIKSLQQRYLEDDQASLYMSGWCWPSKPFNWTVFIFYGGDVKLPGLDLFETVLKAVCDLGCKVEGYFHAQGEDGAENLVYRIVNDAWTVEPGAAMFESDFEEQE
ncbi:MAG TPA: hypothetical protein VFM49_07815 [Chloroflexia bacterium]|jgi:hypothetical protein|nr:hypothetical protein [Chloroflexia bacterium]